MVHPELLKIEIAIILDVDLNRVPDIPRAVLLRDLIADPIHQLNGIILHFNPYLFRFLKDLLNRFEEILPLLYRAEMF